MDQAMFLFVLIGSLLLIFGVPLLILTFIAAWAWSFISKKTEPITITCPVCGDDEEWCKHAP